MRMHKRKLLALAGCLLLTISGINAQNTVTRYSSDTTKYYSTRTRNYLSEKESEGITRNFALGADLDSLEYIVASPFDNWYIEIGAGLQTYIGNEIEKSARHNGLNYNLYAEIGKWVIPDLSMSLYASVFDLSSQSKYSLNPYIDWSSQPNANGYYNTHAYALSVGGLVTLDWTNFLHGYDAGQNRKLHVTTPVGLGYMVNFGKKLNNNPKVPDPINRELYATGALHFDYYATPHTILTANLRGTLTRSSFDYSPYNNLYTNVDWMPSVTIGLRFNLFREVYLPAGDSLIVQEVNHKFLPAHSVIINDRSRLQELQDRLISCDENGSLLAEERDRLLDSIDSLRAIINDRPDEPDDNDNPLANLYELALRYPATSAIVYFQLDRYNLDYNARKTLQNFATRVTNYEDYPETNVYYIVGSADDSTGTARHNWGLSIHRTSSVHNQLTKVLQVPARQLEKVHLGGIHQYSPKQLNRVCIVVLKDERSTPIIKKWGKNLRRD